MIRFIRWAVLVTLLAGCATEPSSVRESQPLQLQDVHSVAFLADIKDQVFGTRLSGLFMKPTEDFQTDWNSDAVLGASLAKAMAMADSGRKFEAISVDRLQLQETIPFDSLDAAFSRLSQEMSRANPESSADIHLIALHVPVDPVPRPIAGAQLRMMGQGLIGLMWELGTSYKQSYVVRVNSDLNAIAWGKAQCIVVYALAVVDAHSHKVMRKLYPRWAEHPLPKDFWIGDYQSLSPERRDLLRNACLDALTSSVEDDLRKMGLR